MELRAIEKLKGFGFMFLSSSLMGGIGAFARFINAPGDFIAFCRSFSGFIMMTLIFAVSGGFKKVKGVKFSASMLFSGIFLGLLSSTYVISTQYTTLANASFLIYTGPVYSTILAAIFLKEPFKLSMVGSLLAVLVGTLFIIGIISEDGIALTLDPANRTGDIIALISGVAYGIFLFVSRYRQDCDSNVRSWYNFLFAFSTIGVMLAIRWSGLVYKVKEGGMSVMVDAEGNRVAADAEGAVPLIQTWYLSKMDGTSWIVLICAALITGFGAFYFLTVASRILLAGELAVISYQETIMATILGFIMFSETLTGMQLIGGVLIVGGGISQIILSTKAVNKKSKKQLAEEAAAAAQGSS